MNGATVHAGEAVTDRLRKLVEEHRKLPEPLVLAVHYRPDRDPQDIFLFEVISDLDDGEADPDREFFEVSFSATEAFPMEAGQRLHLVLTSPEELKVAIEQSWEGVQELRAAAAAGRTEVLYHDDVGWELWELVTADLSA